MKKISGKLYALILCVLMLFPFGMAVISLVGVNYLNGQIQYFIFGLMGICIIILIYFFVKKLAGLSQFEFISLLIISILFLNSCFFNTLECYSVFCVLLWSAITVFILIIIFKQDNFGKQQAINNTLFIMVVAVFLRIIAFHIFQTYPTSDFLRVFNYANPITTDIGRAAHVSSAIASPYYAWEGNLLKIVLPFFGGDVAAAVYVNIAMAAIEILFLSYLGYKLFGINKFMIIPAFLCAVNPIAILHDMILAHENYFVFFFSFMLVIMINWYENVQLGKKKQWLWLILFAISIGIASEFKPVQSIIYIALFIACLFHKKWSKKEFKKSSLFVIASMLIILVVSSMTYNIGIKILEHDIEKDVQMTPFRSLVIGLNLYNGNGSYDQETARLIGEKYNDAYINGDIDDFNNWALEYIYSSWKDNPKEIIPLFIKKFINTWGREGGTYFFWANNSASKMHNLTISEMYGLSIPTYANIFSFIVYICCILGLLYSIKKKSFLVSFNALFIAGFAAMLLLIEAQVRYKAILFPSLYILASYGIIALHEKFSKQKLSSNTSEIIPQNNHDLRNALVAFMCCLILFGGMHNTFYIESTTSIILTENDDDTYTVKNCIGKEGYLYAWYVYDETNERIYVEWYTKSPSFVFPLKPGYTVISFMQDSEGNPQDTKKIIVE